MHYIYNIFNRNNRKIYIGQTNDPLLRWAQHKSNAKYNRGSQLITRAMVKYGVDSFDFSIIATCRSQADADAIEAEVILQYGSLNPAVGYNVNPGGNTSPRTEEVKKNISASLQEYYKNNDGWNKGKTLTKEWKQNISEASMGKGGTNTGKTFSSEWRLNMSKSLSGKENLSRRKFSAEQEMEICRLYVDEKKSMYWLGKEFKCQRTLIDDILVRNNIEKRQSNYTSHSNNRNLFTKEQELEICKIYKEGNISMTGLASKFRCGKTTIRSLLIRYNIKL